MTWRKLALPDLKLKFCLPAAFGLPNPEVLVSPELLSPSQYLQPLEAHWARQNFPGHCNSRKPNWTTCHSIMSIPGCQQNTCMHVPRACDTEHFSFCCPNPCTSALFTTSSPSVVCVLCHTITDCLVQACGPTVPLPVCCQPQETGAVCGSWGL